MQVWELDFGIDVKAVLERASVSMADGRTEEAARCFSIAANYFRLVGDLQNYLSRKRLAADCFMRAAKARVNEGDVSKGFMNYSCALNCFRELGDSESSKACIEEMAGCISDQAPAQVDLHVGRKIAEFLSEIGDHARAASFLEILGERALESGKRPLSAFFLSQAASCHEKSGMRERAAKLHESAAESYSAMEDFYVASHEFVLASLLRAALKDFQGARSSALKAKELCEVGGIAEVWHGQLVEVCFRLASGDAGSARAAWEGIRWKFKPSFAAKVEEALKASR